MTSGSKNAYQHSPIKRHLRSQKINLALSMRVRACGTATWGSRRVGCVTWILVFVGTHVKQPPSSKTPQPKAVSIFSPAHICIKLVSGYATKLYQSYRYLDSPSYKIVWILLWMVNRIQRDGPKKLMSMHKDLYQRDEIDWVSRKKRRRRFAAIKTAS